MYQENREGGWGHWGGLLIFRILVSPDPTFNTLTSQVLLRHARTCVYVHTRTLSVTQFEE